MLIYRAEENPRFLERLVLCNLKASYFSQLKKNLLYEWHEWTVIITFRFQKKIKLGWERYTYPWKILKWELTLSDLFWNSCSLLKMGVHLFPGSNPAWGGVVGTARGSQCGRRGGGLASPWATSPLSLPGISNLASRDHAQIFTTNFLKSNFAP